MKQYLRVGSIIYYNDKENKDEDFFLLTKCTYFRKKKYYVLVSLTSGDNYIYPFTPTSVLADVQGKYITFINKEYIGVDDICNLTYFFDFKTYCNLSFFQRKEKIKIFLDFFIRKIEHQKKLKNANSIVPGTFLMPVKSSNKTEIALFSEITNDIEGQKDSYLTLIKVFGENAGKIIFFCRLNLSLTKKERKKWGEKFLKSVSRKYKIVRDLRMDFSFIKALHFSLSYKNVIWE